MYVASSFCNIPSNVILLQMQSYISMYLQLGATAVFFYAVSHYSNGMIW